MASEQQLPLKPGMSIPGSSPAFCRILCPAASITTVFPKELAGAKQFVPRLGDSVQRTAVRSVGQSGFAMLLCMDVERIIDDIRQLEEIFETPDLSPLRASDVSAANRRHDETLANSAWFQFWRDFGICCRPGSICY
jgi:hypothetical protein